MRIKKDFVKFTEAQILNAANTDLEAFCKLQGEKLLPSGRDKRLASDKSITIRGVGYYDHSEEKGGNAIDFVRKVYGLSFPEAVTMLTGERGEILYPVAKTPKEEPRKEFILPSAAPDCNRVAAFLYQSRHIAAEVVRHFIQAKLIYEENKFHNVVFLGKDTDGIPRHAHKRSSSTFGKPFRMNVEGCDPAHSFHWQGASKRLYVFEAPIDMLSYISLHKQNWQEHSYVSLCGVGEKAMLEQLRRNPGIDKVILCTDYDDGGIEAVGRLTDVLRRENFHGLIFQGRPQCKDWNEDLKASKGLEAQPGEDHSQVIMLRKQLKGMQKRLDKLRKEYSLAHIQEQQRRLREFRQEKNRHCCSATLEDMALLAVILASHKYNRLGEKISPEELLCKLEFSFKPHRNKGGVDKQISEASTYLKQLISTEQKVCSEQELRNQITNLGCFAKHCLYASVGFQIEIKKELERQQSMEQEEPDAEPEMERVMSIG